MVIQAVDPRIAVPYWDYTYDAYLVDRKGGNISQIFDTELWSPSWFGHADDELHTITEGRWAYQQVSRNASAHVKNPYGYLRAPWNVNKSPYVTRVHKMCGATLEGANQHEFKWPTCGSHYNLTFSDEYDSWYSYVWQASYRPHGPVHLMIGGYTNCQDSLESLSDILPSDRIDRLKWCVVAMPRFFLAWGGAARGVR